MASNSHKDFETFLKTQLNSSQKQAVTHEQGPILVVAGAGSGKTRVITARIAHLLINKNVAPHTIVALTFTNKAAHEMKERIIKFMDGSKELPFVGTFHSYCLSLLKKNSSLLGLEYFSILDEDDQKKIISDILKKNNLHKQFNARQIIYQISLAKNQRVTSNENVFDNPLLYDLFVAYEQEKKASRCLDFDDLLLKTHELFEKNPDFKKAFQQQITHVLVDEYQDTNVVQHQLLKQLCLENNTLAVDSICAVGDEDQSIYSWRGATISNMLNFARDFAQTSYVKIEQNYRSVQPILDLANHVIAHNAQRNPKSLWSEKKARNRIHVLTCLSEYQESDIIAGGIKELKKNNRKQSVAVLYRTHAQSRAIEEALIKQSIPYKIIGGVQFYERKEIKDVLAYLRLAVNPFDRPSFFRVINCPARGLGAKFEEQFSTIWHEQPLLHFKQVADHLVSEKCIPPSKQAAVKTFCKAIHEISDSETPLQAAQKLIQEIGYFEHIKNSYEQEEAHSRIDNVKELLHAIKHFEKQGISTLQDFLAEVSLLQERITSSNNEEENVLLMSLHAAKGLEFDTVILAGLEENILPSARSLKEDHVVEEERRLFYVGITRAKERLVLTHAKYRYTYGQMTDQIPSRFAREIPQKLAPKHDCSYWNKSEYHTFFANLYNAKALPTPETKKPTTQRFTKKIASPKSFVSATSPFKKNQPVRHRRYGIGMIQGVEKKSDTIFYVSVKFKTGLKKISSDFLEII